MNASPPVSSYHYQKLIAENVADIIIITNLSFEVQSWNRAATQYYGISEAAAIGRPMTDLVTFTFTGTTLEQAFADLQKNKVWQGEVGFTNIHGQVFYFLQTVKFALDDGGTEAGILAVGRDITRSKIAEQQLLQSEQFYRRLTAESLDTILLVNEAGLIKFCTPSVQKLLGYEANEIVGTTAFTYVHPDDMEWAAASFFKEVEENPEVKFILVRLRKKNGDWLWCMIRGHNLVNTPPVNAIVIYIHDDTPRKLATDALKQSEKGFRTLIRDLQTGVLLQDAAGKIEITNHAMTKLFGITEEEIMGGKIWELYQDVIHEDGRLFLQTERPSFKAMQTRQLVKDAVLGVWHKHRQERIWVLVNADPILDDAGQVTKIVCSFTDITERRKLEQKSVDHQRLLAQATIDAQEKERREVGKELHDNIGQQLTTVKLLLDLAKTTATPENSDMIAMALKGITEVINEVRAVSRSLVPPSLKDLGFIDSVNDLIDSLRHTQTLKVELDYFDFDEDLLPENKKLALFRIIQEQLNNIIKHAGASHVLISLRCTTGNTCLEIKDDGRGFDRSTVRKGLGLTNIVNRAELFGGKAEVFSAPQKGCLIKVVLPGTHNGPR